MINWVKKMETSGGFVSECADQSPTWHKTTSRDKRFLGKFSHPLVEGRFVIKLDKDETIKLEYFIPGTSTIIVLYGLVLDEFKTEHISLFQCFEEAEQYLDKLIFDAEKRKYEQEMERSRMRYATPNDSFNFGDRKFNPNLLDL